MQTLTQPSHAELLVRKSRFLACVEPMADRTQARQRVEALRREHPGATHVCWALMAGGESAAVDDGEPSGTAGRPMLEVLRHQQLDHVLATVVRTFGGIKLGTGGLVRAYGEAVSRALAGAERISLEPWHQVRLSLPYELEGWVRRTLEHHHAQLDGCQHSSLVRMTIRLRQSQMPALRAQLAEAPHGGVLWEMDINDG